MTETFNSLLSRDPYRLVNRARIQLNFVGPMPYIEWFMARWTLQTAKDEIARQQVQDARRGHVAEEGL
jgi:hypothetical protein